MPGQQVSLLKGGIIEQKEEGDDSGRNLLKTLYTTSFIRGRTEKHIISSFVKKRNNKLYIVIKSSSNDDVMQLQLPGDFFEITLQRKTRTSSGFPTSPCLLLMQKMNERHTPRLSIGWFHSPILLSFLWPLRWFGQMLIVLVWPCWICVIIVSVDKIAIGVQEDHILEEDANGFLLWDANIEASVWQRCLPTTYPTPSLDTHLVIVRLTIMKSFFLAV